MRRPGTKRYRARHLTEIGKNSEKMSHLDATGTAGLEAALKAERKTGLPFEPPIAYFFRRFESLGDAIRALRHENPKEPIESEIERLRGEHPIAWEAQVSMAELSLAIQKLEEPLLEALNHPVRRDRDDVASVKSFLERNAAELSRLLGRSMLWTDLVTATHWPEDAIDSRGEAHPAIITRARIGFLIGGLYLAYVEPRLFFETYAIRVDPNRFELARLAEPSCRETTVNDALFAWGEWALLNPALKMACEELSSDPAAAERIALPTSIRERYEDGRPPILGGLVVRGNRQGVHWLRAKHVTAVATWLDHDYRMTSDEASAIEKTLRDTGLWPILKDRRGDPNCRAPGKEALEIVAKRWGVKPSTIKQSLSRTKRRE